MLKALRRVAAAVLVPCVAVTQAPIGAGVVGALLALFLVLLVTDIMGLTTFLPFTRGIR